MDDEKFVTYYVSSIPWKDCPFELKMVVGTDKGKKDAERVLREFYQNPSLEIKELYEITVVRADLFDEAKKRAEEEVKRLDN